MREKSKRERQAKVVRTVVGRGHRYNRIENMLQEFNGTLASEVKFETFEDRRLSVKSEMDVLTAAAEKLRVGLVVTTRVRSNSFKENGLACLPVTVIEIYMIGVRIYRYAEPVEETQAPPRVVRLMTMRLNNSQLVTSENSIF